LLQITTPYRKYLSANNINSQIKNYVQKSAQIVLLTNKPSDKWLLLHFDGKGTVNLVGEKSEKNWMGSSHYE
jgi:hypothetical protein